MVIFKTHPDGKQLGGLSVNTSMTPETSPQVPNEKRNDDDAGLLGEDMGITLLAARKIRAAGPTQDAGRAAGQVPKTADRTIRAHRAMAASVHRLPALSNATNDASAPAPDPGPGVDPGPGRPSAPAPAAQEELLTKVQAVPDDGESLRPFSGSRRSIDRYYEVYRHPVGFRRPPVAKRPLVVICLLCAQPASSIWRVGSAGPSVIGISGAACLGPVPQGGGNDAGPEAGEGDGLTVAVLKATPRAPALPEIKTAIGFMLREAGCQPGQLSPRLQEQGIDVLAYVQNPVSGEVGSCFSPAVTDRMFGRPMRLNVPDVAGGYWAVTVRLRDVTSVLGVHGLRYQWSRTDLACRLPREPGDFEQSMLLLRGDDEKEFRRVMAHLARAVLASACQLEGV